MNGASRNARRYRCPNCAAPLRTAKALVRHLLEEAGGRGVSTSEFLRAGCGSRFGARIHELRHDEGLGITERYLRPGSSLYRLAAGDGQPFDTTRAEFDACVPPYDEAA